jgi:PAS domain S-box-containing protein
MNQGEKWFAKVFMDAADPIIIEDLEGIVIDLNTQAERSYGFSREELIGRPIRELGPPERHEQAMELLARCRAGEEVRNVEGLRWNKEQVVSPVLLTLSALKDESGKITAIASLAKDITSLKAAEERNRRLAKVFRDAADPIIIEDLDGIVVDLNDEAERSYGYSREELIGRPIRELVPPERHEQAMDLLARCRAGEEVRNVEGLRWNKQQVVSPVLLTLSALRDESGKITAIASLAKDITHQKRVEQELEQEREKLEIRVQERTKELSDAVGKLSEAIREVEATQSELIQSERMAILGRLAAGVAHEINSPLGVIQSGNATIGRAVERIRHSLDRGLSSEDLAGDPELARALSVMKSIDVNSSAACARVSKIVDGLKRFASLDKAEVMPVDLNESINGALDLLQHEFRDHTRVRREFGNIPEITGKPAEINQVLITLLTTANESIEGPGEIRIKTACDSETVAVKILDSGKGIPEERIEHLSHLKFSASGDRVGIDIGLATAYHAVGRLGGDLLIESELGTGTQYTLQLPLVSPEQSG